MLQDGPPKGRCDCRICGDDAQHGRHVGVDHSRSFGNAPYPHWTAPDGGLHATKSCSNFAPSECWNRCRQAPAGEVTPVHNIGLQRTHSMYTQGRLHRQTVAQEGEAAVWHGISTDPDNKGQAPVLRSC